MLHPGRKQTLSPLSMDSNDSSFLQQYDNLAGDSPYDAASNRPHGNGPTDFGHPQNGYGLDPSGHAPINRSPPGSRGPPSFGRASQMSTSSSTFSAHGGHASISGDAFRPYNPRAEEMLTEHHHVLRGYLQPHLSHDAAAKSSRARDKLLRLSPTQFHELSTDVYDELLRREDERMSRRADIPPHLMASNSFHPKRNQARQKLSTLPPDRFRQLATDVYYELERRVPRLGGSGASRAPSPAMSTASSSYRGPPRGPPSGMRGPPSGGYRGRAPSDSRSHGMPASSGQQSYPARTSSHDYNKPLPKTFQSNTIVPSKSTMVEDDDIDDEAGELAGARMAAELPLSTFVDHEGLQSNVEALELQVVALQKRLQEMEMTIREKDADLDALESAHRSSMAAERNTWQKTKGEMERRITEHETRAYDYAKREADLRSQQASGMSGSGGEWRERCEQLERQMAEQQRITDEVRREAAGFLSEMRALTQQNEVVFEREEQLRAQVSSLENEVDEWKRRYARAKTELRTMKASSIGLPLQNMSDDILSTRQNAISRDGMVEDVDVTNFQISIDELLQCARSSTADVTVEKMKVVITYVQRMMANAGKDYTGLPSPAASPEPDTRSPHLNGSGGSGGSDGSGAAKDLGAGTLRLRVGHNATGLITATRNYVSSNGMSPVSLVDAAAANLTAAVIDYVRTVGIKPSTSTALQHDSGIDDGYETLSALVHSPNTRTKPLPPAPAHQSLGDGNGRWFSRLKGSIDSTASSGLTGYHRDRDTESEYSDFR